MPSVARSVFLLFVAGVAAQDKRVPKPADLAADLASDTAVTVAWAASRAASEPSKELITPLRKALHTWSDRQGDEADVARLHLLDALLQSGAKVPASDLLPRLNGERSGTVAFAMLLLEPRLHEQEILELFRAGPEIAEHVILDEYGLRKVALGNVLATQRTPGFASHVWRQLDLDLHVVASDPEVTASSSSGFVLLSSVHLPTRKPGFPPYPIYGLVRDDGSAAAGMTLRKAGSVQGGLPPPVPKDTTQWFTTGQLRVGYVRVMSDDLKALTCPIASSGQGFLWLQMIASMNLQRSDTEKVIAYKSRDAFLEEVVAARAKLAAHKKDGLRALVAAGAMTEAEATEAAGATEVHVDDQRTNRSQALPDIPPIK